MSHHEEVFCRELPQWNKRKNGFIPSLLLRDLIGRPQVKFGLCLQFVNGIERLRLGA